MNQTRIERVLGALKDMGVSQMLITDPMSIYYLTDVYVHPGERFYALYLREDGKHIFSHVEWQMIGYRIRVDELENSCTEKMLFVHPEEIQAEYPIPAAFETYTKEMEIRLGQEKFENEV